LLQIENHSRSDLTRELGGALLGHAVQQDGSNLVKVLASLPVITTDHGPVHFTFTADAWALLHRDKAKEYPNLDIVGWYHTHPDLGVFYSADDVIVHSAAFVMPWHVGLVIDPIRGEAFIAGWQQNMRESEELTLASLNGYYEILDLQETSSVSWRLVRSTVWQQDSFPHNSEELSNQVHAPHSEWPALPPISSWWGVVLGGLSLLISILLLIERLLASPG
jgi:proteasome lid subunit RPN8/RPN11